MGDDPRHIEEQRALGFVLKSVRTAERVLLGNAGDRERLTGEAGQQNVMRRDILNGDFGDVAVDFVVVVGEVRGVGLLAVLVPLGRKDALAADGLEAPPQSADAGEQVDKGEICRFLTSSHKLE